MDSSTGIFVTLNPAGKGYAGRQKLPDNLKQLFRPVIMSKPDDTLIAEVILHCEGFKYAPVIGHKLVTLFDLSKYEIFIIKLLKKFISIDSNSRSFISYKDNIFLAT